MTLFQFTTEHLTYGGGAALLGIAGLLAWRFARKHPWLSRFNVGVGAIAVGSGWEADSPGVGLIIGGAACVAMTIARSIYVVNTKQEKRKEEFGDSA